MTCARMHGNPVTWTPEGRGRRRWRASALGAGLSAMLSVLLPACSLDSLLKNDQLPPDVTDPAITQTPEGAVTVYNGAIRQMGGALGGGTIGISFVGVTGLFTDELDQLTGSAITTANPLNQRALFGGQDNTTTTDGPYAGLHRVRGQAGQAIALLTRYLPAQPALAGHMYALEAYAEIMLAELFCSGIPLSTVDYEGDYTYKAGSTTEQVFAHALALLDTGLTLAADSTRFVNLTRVAQGRALLALGQYAAAGAAVAAVPDGYTYALSYDTLRGGAAHDPRNFAVYWSQNPPPAGVGNLEGGDGLNYVTSGDPRSATTPMTGTLVGGGGSWSGYRPTKYALTGATPIVLASGVEARLIQAEAALHAGDAPAWLATLNTLRTNGVSDPPDTLRDTLGVTGCSPTKICGASPASNALAKGQPAGYPPAGYSLAFADTTYPAPAGIQAYCQSASWYKPCTQGDSMVVYTYIKPQFWHAGTGGVGGLDTLSDPGASLSGAAADSARVDLLFRERAFWLFLTGHRQGDLRRLVREYGRAEEVVYPTGPYPIQGNLYGTDVVMPIPASERILNPLFTGCASTGA